MNSRAMDKRNKEQGLLPSYLHAPKWQVKKSVSGPAGKTIISAGRDGKAVNGMDLLWSIVRAHLTTTSPPYDLVIFVYCVSVA